MEVEDAQDYSKLKEELLKRFKLTEGEYRKKFKKYPRVEEETPLQYNYMLNGLEGISDDGYKWRYWVKDTTD